MVLVVHPPLPFTPPSEPYSPYAPYAPIPTRPAQQVTVPTDRRPASQEDARRDAPSLDR
ncbi:hypothetical protein [Paenibacillus sp.]|uniref:hypothetical protein n=1 Tax=Paenibacillus sp. TaxID=58172 RepID=UPI002811B021|nr:hypothetical protein [Paenibacillus sp.]